MLSATIFPRVEVGSNSGFAIDGNGVTLAARTRARCLNNVVVAGYNALHLVAIKQTSLNGNLLSDVSEREFLHCSSLSAACSGLAAVGCVDNLGIAVASVDKYTLVGWKVAVRFVDADKRIVELGQVNVAQVTCLLVAEGVEHVAHHASHILSLGCVVALAEDEVQLIVGA